MAWPHTEHRIESNEIRMTPLANMRETLMGITMHTGELGKSNQESIYFRSWQQMCPEMQHEFSHKFITNTSLAQRTKKTYPSSPLGPPAHTETLQQVGQSGEHQ
jgi:hypothetical protein